jgi:thioredoxin 1
LGAQSIPTFVLYVDGEPTERLVGAQDRETFDQLIRQAS